MNMPDALKNLAVRAASAGRMDRIFRLLNRNNVLILAYHGISRKTFPIAPDTLIPMESFERQMDFISKNYTVLGLGQIVSAMKSGKDLPPFTAAITFDDGYRNNMSEALPILESRNMPATIFLTTGQIGSGKLLPLDEAFLIFCLSEYPSPFPVEELGLTRLSLSSPEERLSSFRRIAAALKRFPSSEQRRIIASISMVIGFSRGVSYERLASEFAMMSWEEVKILSASPLIEIGAHTNSHSILSTLPEDEAGREIAASVRDLAEKAQIHAASFAFPNGKDEDFSDVHLAQLRDAGIGWSVTTRPALNRKNADVFRLSRFCVGNDFASSMDHFRLIVSGFNSAMSRIT